MKKRYFNKSVLISFVSLLVLAICSSLIFYINERNQASDNLELYLETVLTYETIEGDFQQQVDHFSQMYDENYDLRVTIINPNGEVLADSHVNASEMENHSDREEIIEANTLGIGESVRYSTTLNKTVLYVAIKTNENLILRGMIPITGVISNLLQLIPVVIFSLILAMIISLIFANRFSKTGIEPIYKVDHSITKMIRNDFETKIEYTEYDELNSLIKNVNLLSKTINSYMKDINQEKEKLAFVLNNISQGVILINHDYDIVHANSSALNIFGSSPTDNMTLFHLTRQNIILNAVEEAKNNITTKFELELPDSKSIYHVHVLPIDSELYQDSIFIILTDITQSKNNEKIRREFFANASHELRTPITSIMGFSEMMHAEINDCSEETSRYATIIYDESKKLVMLLDDILTISALEETPQIKDYKKINLLETTNEVLDMLSQKANTKNIMIDTKIPSDIHLFMEEKDLVSVLRNLIENAIKYGKEDGNIWIEAKEENNQLSLMIRDDGVGMENSEMDRIFERFYRIDKSRNNVKVPGTGIGLSIVKHIMIKYKGDIEVSSIPATGSIFTLHFTNLIQ